MCVVSMSVYVGHSDEDIDSCTVLWPKLMSDSFCVLAVFPQYQLIMIRIEGEIRTCSHAPSHPVLSLCTVQYHIPCLWFVQLLITYPFTRALQKLL